MKSTCSFPDSKANGLQATCVGLTWTFGLDGWKSDSILEYEYVEYILDPVQIIHNSRRGS